VELLRRSHDTQRLIQKISLGRGDSEDLIALSRTIEATQGISTILGDISKRDGAPTGNCLKQLLHRLSLEGPTELANRISKAIDEEGLTRRQRIEESETANVLVTVREVVDAEADEDEKSTILGKCVSKRETGSNSGGDVGFEDVWVMRKRYKLLSTLTSP
jgi:DNA mismatch repair ATPase MutS